MQVLSKAGEISASALSVKLRPLLGRLSGLVEALEKAGDAPVSEKMARDLSEIASVLRASVEPTPPSATASKRAADDGWPRDMSAQGEEPVWGRDPSELSHG